MSLATSVPATASGEERRTTRPAVILQNDLANRSSPTVTVVPISSSVERLFPFQVRLPSLVVTGAMAAISAISAARWLG